MMQLKQQQELKNYLQQVQQNIETVSASELLQAFMSQPYFGQQSVASGISTGGAWSSIVQLAPPPTGVIYSTAGVHQSPVPATFVPQTLGDVVSATMLNHQQMSSAAVPPVDVVENLHSDTSLPGATSFSPSVVNGEWPVPAVSATDASCVNTDTAAISDSLDLATEVAKTSDRSCSPSVSLRRTSSLKEQGRGTTSSDCEVTNSEQSIHVKLRRKHSAEAAALLEAAAAGLQAVLSTDIPHQLPEVSSLGFVPIQNQSSRSDSMDSMASSLAGGSSQQQSVENSDLIHHSHPVSAREMSVEESKSVSCQPAVCSTSVQPVTSASNQHPAELLDTLQSLLGQFAAGNSDAAAAIRPSHSSPSATVEPAQQLQQSQAIIQQQQQQQVAAIASAIQNLQHLRSLQEAIGSLAVALKTSQIQVLTAALQAGEVSTSAGSPSVPPPASNVTSVAAGSATTMPATLRSPTVPVSSCQPVHVSATVAVPPAAPPGNTVPALVSDPRSLPPSQLTAAQLAALGVQQYPTAGNALMMPSNAVQQQQQMLLLAMMQSAPYQQQQQQMLMQQLLSQNAAQMQQGAVRGGGRIPQQQQPWPMMMMPPHCVANTIRRVPSVPHSGLPAMMSAQQVPTAQRLSVPFVVSHASLPVASTLPPPTAGTAVPLRPAAHTPVLVRPSVTSSLSNASVSSLLTNLPDQR